MSTVAIKVKWGKNQYDVDLNVDESPALLRAQLFALTSVEPDRQKIMLKGKTVKDEDSWAPFGIKAGTIIMMMGSVGEIISAPAVPTLFVEDMDATSVAQFSKFSPGLANLGNTCYLNATVQALFAVPELRSELVNSLSEIPSNSDTTVAKMLGLLFKSLEKHDASDTVTAFVGLLVQALRNQNPRFAEQTQGHYSQQDASECLSELLLSLQNSLVPHPLPGAPAAQVTPRQGRSFIDQFFGLKTRASYKCVENPAEPVSVVEEGQLQLACHIEKNVGYLMAGLKQSLEETVEKMSPSLQRTSFYQRTNALLRLPQFLIVNMVRFFYKKKEGINAKIRKDVKFAFDLDLFELCAPELKEKLLPMRQRFAAYTDAEAAAQASGKLVEKKKGAKADEETVVLSPADCLPSSFEDDIGSNNSGHYELIAVVTHKGASSNSGHYVGWAKQANGTWLMYDDDDVIPQTKENILKLSGESGDWHTAYTLIYGPKRCPAKLQGLIEPSASMDTTTSQ